MYREVSRSSRVFDEEVSRFPPTESDSEDVSYQEPVYHITNDIRPKYQDTNDWIPVHDQSPWVPLLTTTTTRYYTSPSIKTADVQVHKPTPVHGYNKQRLYSRSRTPISRKPSNQVQFKFSPFPVQNTFLKSVKKRPSDYQRKTRRKWQNLSKERRQPKRLSNYQLSSRVSRVRSRNISRTNRKSDPMDLKTKSKLSSVLALSIIGSLLAI